MERGGILSLPLPLSPLALSLSHPKKSNEVLTHTKTEMIQKTTVLSERSQMQKAAYCMIPFMQ